MFLLFPVRHLRSAYCSESGFAELDGDVTADMIHAHNVRFSWRWNTDIGMANDGGRTRGTEWKCGS